MLKVGDRVRVLYAGPRPSLVGKKGTIVKVEQKPAKYDYLVKMDGKQNKLSGGFLDGVIPLGEFYFYSGEVEKI